VSERERVLLYHTMMASTKWWFLKNNQNVFIVKEFHIISMRTLIALSFVRENHNQQQQQEKGGAKDDQQKISITDRLS
jgi:hypothetical protein